MVISDLKIISIEVSDFTKVEEVLANKSRNFDFFRMIFDRVSTLYVRGIEDSEKSISFKETAENWFKEKSINEMSLVIENFRDQIFQNAPQPKDFSFITENSFPLDDYTVLMLNYFSVNTILKAYQNCIQMTDEKNEIFDLEISRNYLSEVIESLFILEDLVSHHIGGEAVRYFVEKTIKEERSGRVKGAQVRYENYKAKMSPIFDEAYQLFINPHPLTQGRWKSKMECAKYYVNDFYKKFPDTDIDLDHKKLVTEISNRINECSASK